MAVTSCFWEEDSAGKSVLAAPVGFKKKKKNSLIQTKLMPKWHHHLSAPCIWILKRLLRVTPPAVHQRHGLQGLHLPVGHTPFKPVANSMGILFPACFDWFSPPLTPATERKIELSVN